MLVVTPFLRVAFVKFSLRLEGFVMDRFLSDIPPDVCMFVFALVYVELGTFANMLAVDEEAVSNALANVRDVLVLMPAVFFEQIFYIAGIFIPTGAQVLVLPDVEGFIVMSGYANPVFSADKTCIHPYYIRNGLRVLPVNVMAHNVLQVVKFVPLYLNLAPSTDKACIDQYNIQNGHHVLSVNVMACDMSPFVRSVPVCSMFMTSADKICIDLYNIRNGPHVLPANVMAPNVVMDFNSFTGVIQDIGIFSDALAVDADIATQGFDNIIDGLALVAINEFAEELVPPDVTFDVPSRAQFIVAYSVFCDFILFAKKTCIELTNVKDGFIDALVLVIINGLAKVFMPPDVMCIDQNNIRGGFRVWPVNVMACSKALVICGAPYPNRL